MNISYKGYFLTVTAYATYNHCGFLTFIETETDLKGITKQ
jgi:hypothetical protein